MGTKGKIPTRRVKIGGESCSEQRTCFEREGAATGHLRRLRGQEAEALLLRHADRSFQPDLRWFSPSRKGPRKNYTGAGRSKGHSTARGSNPQAEHDRSSGRDHEPLARSVHRASGDGKPEERRGETSG